jgi:hypothetical protein
MRGPAAKRPPFATRLSWWLSREYRGRNPDVAGVPTTRGGRRWTVTVVFENESPCLATSLSEVEPGEWLLTEKERFAPTGVMGGIQMESISRRSVVAPLRGGTLPTRGDEGA